MLGGGLVKGSLVLLGGEPGIGKSTMLLQICQYLGQDHTILYVSGEESVRQIKLRANRLHVDSENLYLLADNDCEQICSVIDSHNRLDTDNEHKRDILSAGVCDAGKRMYKYVHAHSKVGRDTNVHSRSRQQGRCYRRTKGHGTHC